ncbi:hypothetical protein L0Z36_26175 [Burkholderia multivorans]|uniref:hypothetical protein n=1 Tax=Burkholderia multivorans TaxID=87883 RepID=UPI00201863DC|nr:hypothetical protein [Burkholderia multivorans]UQP02906.1 hypothetical protein L0Z36_26175 [Burkholderia multivorans]
MNYTTGLHVLEKMGSQERVIDRQNQDLQKKNEAIGEANYRAGMAEAAGSFAKKEAKRYQEERDFYKDLLSKPFAEIAARDGRFRETYEKQQEMLADWIASQRAFRELAMKYGKLAGKTPEEIKAEGLATEAIILADQSQFGNTVNEATKVALKRKKAREEKAAHSA